MLHRFLQIKTKQNKNYLVTKKWIVKKIFAAVPYEAANLAATLSRFS